MRNSAKCRRITYDTHKKAAPNGDIFMLCRCGRGLRPDCGNLINPKHHWTWDAHHFKAKADGGEDSPENLFPVLTLCHEKVVTPDDVKRLAKDRRIKDRRDGVRVPKAPMMGSRNHPSRLRKRMNGKVERW